MCGISGYFARESKPNKGILRGLFEEGSKRGTDGFGWVLIHRKQCISHRKYKGLPDFRDVLHGMPVTLELGDIILSNSRAAPETESAVNESKLEQTVQPVILDDQGLYLVHNGSCSNFIVNELKKKYTFQTDIDSEAILWAYIKFGRNMQEAMEYLSGGFAFLMMDTIKNKLFAVTTHNPLYTGYVRGHGLFFSSTEEGVLQTVSKLKGVTINKNTLTVWEDYYIHQISENTIQEIDLDSGMVNEYKFEPRYVTSTYDCYNKEMNDKPVVLVASSGGLDSSTTLAALKEAEMNPVAVHFKYGHRGQEAEEIAIREVVKLLDIPLYTFNISENMKILDSGMLTDKDAKIITGTDAGLKTTAAWTVYRNHLFMTYMGALAESLIMKDNYSQVFLTGGFMNLSESGSYPDNSERFIDAAMKFFKFSITGTRLRPLYGMCNILKTEQYVLLNELGWLEKLSPWLVSCDRPITQAVIAEHWGDSNRIPLNCSKDGKPACGSGLLSYWAAKMAGVPDLRRYYNVNDPEYKAFEPNSSLSVKDIDIDHIISRIMIPEKYLEILRNKVHNCKNVGS